ncbi:MAG: RlmE family RNA methyltransferase [Candidatus Fonsibacter lacus]|uniref:Ribosomal RNA large subunit methyltransferase E n=2 Tax=Candidatus Fonsibacter lacus TaxID=2576439 RepID=A0A845SDJ5_9PROT|nr:RlmE family RNA methyltransferase [Candidatus Fonsibacter lacus]NBP30990.1 RlmE family RNA methyltransferase [Candidatus Fonsibacter lacus]NCU62635.1 RlmE family RNA methyltransferase [Candidatus Fonsibacter lacus]NCU74095.1 RlmE family RNA methyltransferase [Candidatus Fonsibacter lacus]
MKKFKNKNLTASSKSWITRQFNDPYTKLAKQKGYRSRSAFKLIEINKKFKFLKNNLNIVDLGSAPGGWSQVCSKINKNGKNLSIDILDMDKIDNIFFYKKDFNEVDFLDFVNNFFDQNKVDIVLSDMAVNTTGNKDLDAIKTNSIALDVINLSKVILKPKSTLLVKIFSGKDEDILIKNAKDFFKSIERIKPDSSRKESREMYLLCRNLKTV